MNIRTLALSAAVIASPFAASAEDSVLPPGSSVAGRSLSQLSAEWWQWAMLAPDEENPVNDLTGSNCAVGQRGAVWFLAGGFGSTKVRRVCTVPAGRALFFPVINMAYWPRRGNTAYTCPQAKAAAAVNNDAALDLFAEIDGVAIEQIKQHRVSSEECFDIFSRVSPERRSYNGYPAATDGYWLLVQPLSKSRHVLRFGGRYSSSSAYGRMLQDIEYELVVQ